MYPVYSYTTGFPLSEDDIEGIQALYGGKIHDLCLALQLLIATEFTEAFLSFYEDRMMKSALIPHVQLQVQTQTPRK